MIARVIMAVIISLGLGYLVSTFVSLISADRYEEYHL